MTTSDGRSCWRCRRPLIGDPKLCPLCGEDGHITRLLLGRYRVREFVGEGTFGEVYRCFDPVMHREVAVKRLKTTAPLSEDFAREVGTQGPLEHDNVVRVYDVDLQLGLIVMEYLGGRSLLDRMNADINEVRRNFLPIAREVTEALRVAHRAKVCHRDVKPANILFSESARAKLGDFGLARVITDSALARSRVGTPVYEAPEVMSGAPYSHDVDIYSLGVTFYEIWAGRLPFQATTYNGLAVEKASGQYISLESVNPAVPKIVDQLISLMMSERRPSAAVVLDELVRWSDAPLVLETLEDYQSLIGRIYGRANRARGPLLLTSYVLANLEGIVGGLRAIRTDYGRERASLYLPRTFAWICSLLSALDCYASDLVQLKYPGVCPYCGSAECVCGDSVWSNRNEANRTLLRRLQESDGIFRGGAHVRFPEYVARLSSIYGAKNAAQGTEWVCMNALASVAQVTDSLLNTLGTASEEAVSILQLELADLLAWFAALLGVHVREFPDYEFEAEFVRTFGSGCYRCNGLPCECGNREIAHRLVNWRRFDDE